MITLKSLQIQHKMCTNAEDIRALYVDCLTQQLNELEILQSIYPNKDDIVLTDNKILKRIQNFLDNASEYTPSHLDYTVTLLMDNLKLEICINLPTTYPKEIPNVYLRCNQLNRPQETQLNSDLSHYIKDSHSGDVSLYNAISWIQENIHNYANNINNSLNQCKEEDKPCKDQYVRLWIYSHHIYNKKKREEIVKKARDLNLTGFCLSGKPGIVCIEGTDENCGEWWKDIKSMTWKKIGIRKTEELESAEQFKFTNFEEIQVDMSTFSKYLDKHGLSQAFNEVFRLNNE